MKMRKKSQLSIMLTGVMVLTAAMPAFAAENVGSSSKEEVVYVNLQADGTVEDIYVVNIFGKGPVTDYGDYSSVKMLNTNDVLTQNGEKITFDASADRTYYEGTLKSRQIPWDISLEYRLDGKKYEPDELAGKSGRLEIHFVVTQNNACREDFYENYALQASFTLDTETCDHIMASDATIANVGSDKQISYTILPGKGIDTIITADVQEFEMDAVSINGIPLSMNVEVDDEELMDQVADLQDAIGKLDDGAGDLRSGTSDLKNQVSDEFQGGVNDLVRYAGDMQDGAAELQDGGTQLNEGTRNLQDGAQTLYNGLESLNEGISLTQNGLNELNAKSSELTKVSAEMKSALQEIQSRLNNISGSTEKLTTLVQSSGEIGSAIEGLSAGVSQLQNNISFQAYKAAMQENGLDIEGLQSNNEAEIDELNAQIEQLSAAGEDTSQLQGMVTLLQGNNAAIYGMDSYLQELNSNSGELASSAAALSENYSLFQEGMNELSATMSGMLVQMSELQNGINTLVDQYGKLDAGLNDYTSGVAQITAGYSQISSGSEDVLNGSRDLKDGTATVYGKTGELLSGITEFYDATGSLKDGTGKLDDGVAELMVGISDLYNGTDELKSGTGELRSETDGMDTEIEDQIDEMLKSITGEDLEIRSFVSTKNTDVTSVQFVIQTKAIESPDVNHAVGETEAPLTFWQKFLRLFHLY